MGILFRSPSRSNVMVSWQSVGTPLNVNLLECKFLDSLRLRLRNPYFMAVDRAHSYVFDR